MRRCEFLVRGLLAFVLAYGVIAVYDYGREVWPFFSWNLFTKVPAPLNGDYDVRIVTAPGSRLHLPIYYEDARLQSDKQLIQGYQTLQNWGRFTRDPHRDPSKAEAARQRFASLYLATVPHARYEFVHRVWDIRTRVSCRTCFRQVTVLGTYTAG